jgi:hypothetical protein
MLTNPTAFTPTCPISEPRISLNDNAEAGFPDEVLAVMSHEMVIMMGCHPRDSAGRAGDPAGLFLHPFRILFACGCSGQ